MAGAAASAWAVEMRENWSASAAIRARTDGRPTGRPSDESYNIAACGEFQGVYGKYFGGLPELRDRA
jgi:hypothetical protein